MGKGDEYIRIQNGSADFGFFYIDSIPNRNQSLVGAFQTIADDNMAAGREWGKTVGICAVQMVQCIFSASDIQGVAVRQIGLARQPRTGE